MYAPANPWYVYISQIRQIRKRCNGHGTLTWYVEFGKRFASSTRLQGCWWSLPSVTGKVKQSCAVMSLVTLISSFCSPCHINSEKNAESPYSFVSGVCII